MSRFLFLLAALASACSGSEPTAAGKKSPTTDDAEGYIVAGRVTDSAGRPLAGLRVRVVPHVQCVVWGVSGEDITTADGAFRVEGLVDGPHRIRVEASGYAPADVGAPSGDDGVVVTLYRPATVRGLVVAADGRPVAARLEDRSGQPGVFASCPERCVDATGRFAYDDLEPGRFALVATAEDGREARLAVELREGEEREVRLVVRSPFSYARLRILDAFRAPVPAGELRFHMVDERVEATAANGAHVLALRLPAGRPALVHVWRNRRPAADVSVRTTAGHDGEPREVVLPEPVPVRFEASAAVGDISVELWNGDCQLSSVPERLSPACRYDVRMRAPGRATATVFGWQPPARGGVLHVPLEPRRAGRVQGTVLDEEGLPLAGALVLVGRQKVRVAADGGFAADGVRPGRHAVIAAVGRYRVAAATIDVRAGECVECRLTARGPRRVSGRVLDAARNGLGGATVRFVPAVRGSIFDLATVDWTETTTHADGRFSLEIPGVDGGLIARKEGHGTRPFEWFEESSGLEVALPPPARVRVAREGGPQHTLWTCSVRWPAIDPHAVWDSGNFLPAVLEVAPGEVEVTASFESGRIVGPPRPGESGSRTRRVRCAAGETVDVVFRD